MGRLTDISWAAGIMEGEGSFCARKSKKDRGLVAKLKMADEDIVRRFHTVVGVGNTTGPYQAAPNRKPVWVWQTGSFEGVQYVAALLWHELGIRRRGQIKHALATHHARGAE